MTIQQHASFDSSAAELNATSKLVKAWESKNAKNAAKAGGISMMALSLAACGGSSTTTTTAVNGSIASTFRFSANDDTVNAITASIQAADTLLDGSATDTDTIAITSTGAMNAMTAVNIEAATVNMASGTPTAVFTNFTGLSSVSVTGTTAGTVTDAGTATVTLDGYTRVLTVNDSTGLGGTAAAGTAETINLALNGATYGATAATQSGVTLTAANTGADENLEVLNITSSGSAANDFALNAADADVVLKTVNFLGTADVTARVVHAEVSGVTIVGTANTGSTTLMVDRTGATTTDTNVANFSGIDNIVVKDSAAPAVGGDGGDLIGLDSGQKVTLADDFNATVLTITPATYATPAASLTVALDNETAATNTDVASIDVQNVTALNIMSNGHGASVSTSAATINLIDDLTGDASTITITGDTALNLDANIDGQQTASGTDAARAVTVNASGMTGTSFLDFAAAANAKVSYVVTGTDNADTIVVNASGSTVTAGGGKDSITGGVGVDTIDAGDAADTIVVSQGADVLTGGAGADTYDTNLNVTAAVVHKITSGDTDGALTTVAAQDDIIVVVNGVTYATDMLTDGDTADDIAADFVAEHASAILAAHSVTVAVETGGTAGTEGLVFTGKADGTTFTADVSLSDNGTIVAVAETTNATGTAKLDVLSTITDFAAGDILDMAGALTEAGISYYEGAAASSVAANNVYVLTDVAGFADAEAAEDAIIAGTISTDTADGIIVFINSTLGHAQVVIDGDVDANANNLGASDGDAVMFNLTGITNATDLAAAFSADSFVI
jgi:hypothetical protein